MAVIVSTYTKWILCNVKPIWHWTSEIMTFFFFQSIFMGAGNILQLVQRFCLFYWFAHYIYDFKVQIKTLKTQSTRRNSDEFTLLNDFTSFCLIFCSYYTDQIHRQLGCRRDFYIQTEKKSFTHTICSLANKRVSLLNEIRSNRIRTPASLGACVYTAPRPSIRSLNSI